ncbi:MAG: hypothetical protein JXR03_12260, partial [Cyclobacteriaceae bacterium]
TDFPLDPRNLKDGKDLKIEVKFRSDGCFSVNGLTGKKEFPHSDVLLILVSPESIKCLTVEELKSGKKISKEGKTNYLYQKKEFQVHKERILKYTNYVKKCFAFVEQKKQDTVV